MENGFKINVTVSDENIDHASDTDYVECGNACLDVCFDTEEVNRQYRIYMKPDFFAKPEVPADIGSLTDDIDDIYGDFYIRIRVRKDGSAITFDTDIDNLLSDVPESLTLGLIEPVDEEEVDPDDFAGTYMVSGKDDSGQRHYFMVDDNEKKIYRLPDNLEDFREE